MNDPFHAGQAGCRDQQLGAITGAHVAREVRG